MYVDDTQGKADLAQTADILRTSGGVLFRVQPRGALQIAALMKQMGQINSAPASIAAVASPGKAIAGAD